MCSATRTKISSYTPTMGATRLTCVTRRATCGVLIGCTVANPDNIENLAKVAYIPTGRTRAEGA
eukprot:5891877-Pleurochrysis_carterae.AAC.2